MHPKKTRLRPNESWLRCITAPPAEIVLGPLPNLLATANNYRGSITVRFRGRGSVPPPRMIVPAHRRLGAARKALGIEGKAQCHSYLLSHGTRLNPDQRIILLVPFCLERADRKSTRLNSSHGYI